MKTPVGHTGLKSILDVDTNSVGTMLRTDPAVVFCFSLMSPSTACCLNALMGYTDPQSMLEVGMYRSHDNIIK